MKTKNSKRLMLGAIHGLTAALLLVAAFGCKKSEAPAPKTAAANPVNPADAPDVQEKARVAQAVAQRSGIAPAAPALQLRGGEPATPEVMAAFNQELALAIFRERDAPESLEELVRKWRLPKLPTPPAGKRIVYDPVKRIIQLDPP